MAHSLREGVVINVCAAENQYKAHLGIYVQGQSRVTHLCALGKLVQVLQDPVLLSSI